MPQDETCIFPLKEGVCGKPGTLYPAQDAVLCAEHRRMATEKIFRHLTSQLRRAEEKKEGIKREKLFGD